MDSKKKSAISKELSPAALAEAAREDRLRTLGLLTASVAHDLRTPLTFIGSNVEYVLENLHELRGKEARAALDEALQGVQHVATIVSELTAFIRCSELTRCPTDLGRAISAAMMMARTKLAAKARVSWEERLAPPAAIDRTHLVQVVLNLLTNAAHAIPEGDVLGNEIRVVSGPGDEGTVFVEVRDSGRGVSPSVRERIFEPTFTTDVAHGSGLGLAICRRLVEAAGGTLTHDDAPSGGAIFRVVLPSA